MESGSNSNAARESIFQSIRSHLAASVDLDVRENQITRAPDAPLTPLRAVAIEQDSASLVELFKEQLESVDGHCVVVESELELVRVLTDIISQLQRTNLRARKIAISDSPEVERLVKKIGIDVDEIAVAPSATDVFGYDVGISRAQAAIAETGTLLLDSSRERHRLVSLVPPVHIAIIDASEIVATLGEALARLREEEQLSPIVTLVTGPSRTADIELTLAIGVHGPQELYVIVRNR
ncbi:MAG TPA: lactate utilization protein [Pyrinomonadaceae bacterium]|jgi:L-lactate dehydrogenase complex protein LldG|nr:lactate utilization protein [Pyrinomonadaceae bacterium]